jgi:hypothetical protein
MSFSHCLRWSRFLPIVFASSLPEFSAVLIAYFSNDIHAERRVPVDVLLGVRAARVELDK